MPRLRVLSTIRDDAKKIQEGRHCMNIAFFASGLTAACMSGRAAYYRGMVRALHARGHRITLYEPDTGQGRHHRDHPDPLPARFVAYAADTPAKVLAAVEQATAADLVVKVGGCDVHDALLDAAVLCLQAPGCGVVFWDADAPDTLERMNAHPHDALRTLLPRYDLVLTHGGGEPVRRAYRALGVRNCVPICNALDPATHFPVERHPGFDGMLSFLGNRVPDREERIEEYFLRAAAQLPMHRMLLGGGGWHDKFVSPNVRCLGHVTTDLHNRFNCSTRAVLNVSRASRARYGFTPAARLFEAAGAAACLITDDWPGLETFFEPGKEILVARNGDEVAQQVDRLSAGAARKIGRAARARALAEHTYAHRAAQFDAVIDGRGVARSVEVMA